MNTNSLSDVWMKLLTTLIWSSSCFSNQFCLPRIPGLTYHFYHKGSLQKKGLGLRGHEKDLFSYVIFLLISANYYPPLPWSLEKCHSDFILFVFLSHITIIITSSTSGASVRASARGRSTAPSSELAAQVSKWSANSQQIVSKWSTNCQQIVNKWSANGQQIVSKWSTNGQQMVNK